MYFPEIKLTRRLLAKRKPAEEGGDDDAGGVAVADEPEGDEEAQDRGAGKPKKKSAEPEPDPEVPDVDDEPEEVEPTEPEEPAEPEPVAFADLLKKHNFEVPEGKDEVSYLEELLERAAKAGELSKFEQERGQYQQALQEMQRREQQILAHYQGLAQQQGGQLTPQQMQQAQQDRYERAQILKHWQNKPDWNDRYLEFIEKDPETGKLTVAPGGRPDLLALYRDQTDWERKAQQAIYSNPHDFVVESILFDPQNRVGQLVQQYVTHMLGQYQQTVLDDRQQQTALNVLREVGPWAFKNGQNPDGGYTDAGKLYVEVVTEEEAEGLKDPARLHSKAMRAVKRVYGEDYAKPKEKPVETKAARQVAFLKNQAQRAGSRGGSLPRNGNSPKQNESIDPVEHGLQLARAAGIAMDDPAEGL